MSESELKELGFEEYRRTKTSWMRPYVLGEDMDGISVSDEDHPETDHGFVAINIKNPADQWYVATQYVADNLRKIQ